MNMRKRRKLRDAMWDPDDYDYDDYENTDQAAAERAYNEDLARDREQEMDRIRWIAENVYRS